MAVLTQFLSEAAGLSLSPQAAAVSLQVSLQRQKWRPTMARSLNNWTWQHGSETMGLSFLPEWIPAHQGWIATSDPNMTRGNRRWKELTEKAKHLHTYKSVHLHKAKGKDQEKRGSDQMHTFTGAKATRTDKISPSVTLDWLGKEATPSPAGREKELEKSCSQNCQPDQVYCSCIVELYCWGNCWGNNRLRNCINIVIPNGRRA